MKSKIKANFLSSCVRALSTCIKCQNPCVLPSRVFPGQKLPAGRLCEAQRGREGIDFLFAHTRHAAGGGGGGGGGRLSMPQNFSTMHETCEARRDT